MPGSKSSELPRGNPWTGKRPGWGRSGEPRRTSGNSRMFVVLDTNHYDELANDSVFGRNARRRIESHLADVFISVVSVQESVQGWMALINRKRPGHEQVHAYARFQHCIEALTRIITMMWAARISNLPKQLWLGGAWRQLLWRRAFETRPAHAACAGCYSPRAGIEPEALYRR